MNNAVKQIAKQIAAKKIESGFIRDLAIMDAMKQAGFGPMGNSEVSLHKIEQQLKEMGE